MNIRIFYVFLGENKILLGCRADVTAANKSNNELKLLSPLMETKVWKNDTDCKM